MLRIIPLVALGGVLVASCLAPLAACAQDLDEVPEVLVPAQPRSESDRDRLTASAMFAHGRLLYQREKYDAALRRYQRAWRYDPEATSILHEIVALASELNRHAEASRYAVLAADADPQDATLLRRLAMYLTEQQDYRRALQFYQKSLELQKEPDDVTAVLLSMEMGRLHFLLEEYPQAAEQFSRVREAVENPEKFGLSAELKKIVLGNASSTYALLGESFLQAGRYDDAEAMFGRSHEAEADAPRWTWHRARIRVKQQRHDEALKLLDEYMAAKGSSAGVEAYDLLAEVLKETIADEKERSAELLKRLEAAYAADGENVALAFAYGRALHQAGRSADASTILAKSLDKEVTAETAALQLQILRSEKKTAELLALLGKTAGKTGSLTNLGQDGEELQADGEMTDLLLAEARAQHSKGELSPEEALGVALWAHRAKAYDAAEEMFAIVADKPPVDRSALPRPEVVITWALELMQADEFARAANVLQRVIDKKLAPGREELVYFFLAGALEMQGKTDEALAAMDKALAGVKQPTAQLVGRKAWILYHAKRYAEAEQAYLALLEKFDKDHKSPDTRQSLRDARLVLSNICVHGKRRQEATEWLEQVLDEFPEDIGAMNDLGYLWAEDGIHLPRALAMTQRAVAAEPENRAYRDSLGWAWYQLGQYEKAIAELELAAASEEPDGVILDHLGDAYYKAGQHDKALEAWRRAVEAFGKEADEPRQKATAAKIEKHTAK